MSVESDTYGKSLYWDVYEDNNTNLRVGMLNGVMNRSGHVGSLHLKSNAPSRDTLQTKDSNGNWNDRVSVVKYGGDRYYSLGSANYWSYKYGQTTTLLSEQEFANGVTARVRTISCPDGSYTGSGESPRAEARGVGTERRL